MSPVRQVRKPSIGRSKVNQAVADFHNAIKSDKSQYRGGESVSYLDQEGALRVFQAHTKLREAREERSKSISLKERLASVSPKVAQRFIIQKAKKGELSIGKRDHDLSSQHPLLKGIYAGDKVVFTSKSGNKYSGVIMGLRRDKKLIIIENGKEGLFNMDRITNIEVAQQ